MMAVEISAATSQIIECPISIRLPKWVWVILYARAKALHNDDLEACAQELLDVGIGSEIKIMGPAPTGPGGRG